MNLIEALRIEDIFLNEIGYRARMKLGKFHEQPFGYVNGGAILAFGEITAGHASNLLSGGEYHALGQAISANHMKSVKAERVLYANAELLHKGEKSHVWNIRMENENGELISMVTVTNAIIRNI